jgi:hypothetical protein
VKRFGFFLGLAVMAVTASTARADVVYQYVDDLPGGTFTGPTGSTVTVNVFLQETVTKGTSYIAAQNGLFSAGYQITRPTTGGGDAVVSAQAAQIGAGQGFAGGPATITGPINQGGLTFWRTIEAVSPTAPNGPLGMVNGNTTDVLLGTATFQVGTADTAFSLGEKTTGTNTVAFFPVGTPPAANLDIDTPGLGITGAGTTGPVTININVQAVSVPEPSSMALCGLAVCSMGIGAWRRYKAPKAADLVEA